MNFTKIMRLPLIKIIVSGLLNFFFIIIRRIKKKTKKGSVLVISLHKLGDSIFTIPAIRKIQNLYPDVHIVCFPETVSIFKLQFPNQKYIEINHNEIYLNNRIMSNKGRLKISLANPTLIYDLTGSVTSATMIFNSSAEKIIGINHSWFSKIYNEYHKIKIDGHISSIYSNVVSNLPEISSNKENNINGNYFLIHPFAGWRAKEWAFPKFIELAKMISIYSKVRFIIPSSQNSEVWIDILNQNKIEYYLTENTEQLISSISECSLFIGNDSGPAHIANLLGKPTFTIYGPTNPTFHQPLDGKNGYYFKRIHCSPKADEKMCSKNGGQTGCYNFLCIDNIKVSDVAVGLEQFIKMLKDDNN